MFHRYLAERVERLFRVAPPAAFAILCLWAALLWAGLAHSGVAADEKEAAAAAIPESVEVFGKVVDDETGKPVMGFIVQAGKFDPKTPKQVTWGFSESRTTSGNFSANVKWNQGWTARILAEGYLSQPVLEDPPAAGKARIEKVIRLKRGRTIRGRVLDHKDQPVKAVSVFAIRQTNMTLAGGKVVHSFDGEEDPTVRGVKTDDQGRFELPLGDPPPMPSAGDKENAAANGKPTPAVRPGLVVSSPAIDAWPAPLPEGNDEAVIRLPSPTHVEIKYDIDGADEEGTIFLQSVMHEVEAWKGFEVIRQFKIKNKGQVQLESLPPGRYQFARSRMLQHGNIGQGHFLDRQYIDVVSDQTTTIDFERPSGARLKGSVEWDEGTKLTGIIISVKKVLPPDASPADRLFAERIDARLLRVSSKDKPDGDSEITGNRGLFLTERIPPGTYELHAEGYAPLTPEQQRRSGIIGPTLTAQVTVTVPESGVVPSLKLELKKPAAAE
ncbi:MAG: collagen binding domain-containing protein [Planctomycetales bacterium]